MSWVTDAKSKADQEKKQAKALEASIKAAKELSEQQEYNRKHQIFIQDTAQSKQLVENILHEAQAQGLFIEGPTENFDDSTPVGKHNDLLTKEVDVPSGPKKFGYTYQCPWVYKWIITEPIHKYSCSLTIYLDFNSRYIIPKIKFDTSFYKYILNYQDDIESYLKKWLYKVYQEN